MDFSTSKIGFIGVGAMGKCMVRHLAEKTPAGAQIYLHDINQAVIDSLCKEFPQKLTKCSSAKEVADKAVSVNASNPPFPTKEYRHGTNKNSGYSLHYAPRGPPRPSRLS